MTPTEGPTWKIHDPERSDPLEAAALRDIRSFADQCAERLAHLDRTSAEILRAGILAANTFDPTVSWLRRSSLDPKSVKPLAVGKAAVPMALAWKQWGGPPGLLVVPRGTDVPRVLHEWDLQEAEHPRPGDGSYAAGRKALDHASHGGDFVLLLSGGASSLLEAPLVSRHEHQEILKPLLGMGLPIGKLNAARGLLSRIKVGGLARAIEDAGGSLTVLYASDVPGDEAHVVGSGPGAQIDLDTLRKRVQELDSDVSERILEAAQEKQAPHRATQQVCVVSRSGPSKAAAAKAKSLDLNPILAPASDGRVEEEAAQLASRTAQLEANDVLILWGEPVVKLPETTGHGGRTSHLLASLASQLGPRASCLAALAATDGYDGSGIGGAYAHLDGGLDAKKLRQALQAFDTGSLFQNLSATQGGIFPARLTAANCADIGLVRPRA